VPLSNRPTLNSDRRNASFISILNGVRDKERVRTCQSCFKILVKVMYGSRQLCKYGCKIRGVSGGVLTIAVCTYVVLTRTLYLGLRSV
jgi:hypothetical protein